MSNKIPEPLTAEPDTSNVCSDDAHHSTIIDTTALKDSKTAHGAGNDSIDRISRLETLVEEVKRENARIKKEYEECNEQKRRLLVELDASRATSIERKDRLRILQEENNSKNITLESMKEQIESYILSQQHQQETLIKLESQLDLLKELFLRD